MPAKDNRGLFFCAVICSIGCFFAWSVFVTEFTFADQQRRALCYDARAQDAPMASAMVWADDSDDDEGVVSMQCMIPVAAYVCFDDEGLFVPSDLEGSSCPYRSELPSGGTSQEDWPVRFEDTHVVCHSHGLGALPCDDNEGFDCADGSQCNAYEKTLRICMGKLRAAPYSCFTLEGHDIEDEQMNFPLLLLFVAVVVTCCLGCICCVVLDAFAKAEDPFASATSVVGILLFTALGSFAFWGLTTVIVQLMQDDEDDSVNRAATYADFAHDSGGSSDPSDPDCIRPIHRRLLRGHLVRCEPILSMPHEPDLEGTPEWFWPFIIGTIIFLNCLCCCCCLCLVASAHGHAARAKALEAASTGDVETSDEEEPEGKANGPVGTNSPSHKGRAVVPLAGQPGIDARKSASSAYAARAERLGASSGANAPIDKIQTLQFAMSLETKAAAGRPQEERGARGGKALESASYAERAKALEAGSSGGSVTPALPTSSRSLASASSIPVTSVSAGSLVRTITGQSSNHSVYSTHSRDEIKTAVRSCPKITKAESRGHQFLCAQEDTQEKLKEFLSRVRFERK